MMNRHIFRKNDRSTGKSLRTYLRPVARELLRTLAYSGCAFYMTPVEMSSIFYAKQESRAENDRSSGAHRSGSTEAAAPTEAPAPLLPAERRAWREIEKSLRETPGHDVTPRTPQ